MGGFHDFFWIDAFADKPFGGNAAAVCIVDEWPAHSVMQGLAAETALSETAFIKAAGDDFEIRWFTPTVELGLVGHATLAAAHAIMEYIQPKRSHVKFAFCDGTIVARRMEHEIAIILPTDSIHSAPAAPDLCAGLGVTPQETFQGRHHIAVFGSPADVAAIVPDYEALSRLPLPTIAITAPGEDCDYVLRFFAPRNGVPEDPVSGVAQCSLVPLWSERLGKKNLLSRQLSSRGAMMRCTLQPSGVLVAGPCTLIFRGRLNSSLFGVTPKE